MPTSKQTEKETARIRDEALKRAFQMPHKPHEPLGRAKKKVVRKPRKGQAKS